MLALLGSCISKPKSLNEILESETIRSYENILADSSLFKRAFLIRFKQPIDHNAPEKGTFDQRIWLSHLDAEAPVVIVTEGYSASRNYTTELASLLHSNQIIVEHRYFEESTPKDKDWQYLNIEQAAKDHHRIIEFFKQYYPGKWISTGISKGGQTTLYHRSFFPDDVVISVPYVAPINLSREDQRLFDFFEKVGTEEQRTKIRDFQKAVLEERNQIMPLFRQFALEKGFTFRMGDDQAFDLVVLEYPFSFWQWHGQTNLIPESSASAEELFDHLSKYSDISYVSDQSWEGMKPFFYQAYTELGYYAYVPGDIKPLLIGFDKDTISSCLFAPNGENLIFDATAMHEVMTRLKQHNPEILAIVGSTDPWGATSINTDNLSNTLKLVSNGGNHRTRINTLSEEQKQMALDQLNQWLKQ